MKLPSGRLCGKILGATPLKVAATGSWPPLATTQYPSPDRPTKRTHGRRPTSCQQTPMQPLTVGFSCALLSLSHLRVVAFTLQVANTINRLVMGLQMRTSWPIGKSKQKGNEQNRKLLLFDTGDAVARCATDGGKWPANQDFAIRPFDRLDGSLYC
jgi:hypothetical protein